MWCYIAIHQQWLDGGRQNNVITNTHMHAHIHIKQVCLRLGPAIDPDHRDAITAGSLQSLDWNSGLEWWTGMVDWNGGIAKFNKVVVHTLLK